MEKADLFFSDDDFDLLEDFLLSDKVGDDAMTVSVLDVDCLRKSGPCFERGSALKWS
jgi:hypothetical protein